MYRMIHITININIRIQKKQNMSLENLNSTEKQTNEQEQLQACEEKIQKIQTKIDSLTEQLLDAEDNAKEEQLSKMIDHLNKALNSEVEKKINLTPSEKVELSPEQAEEAVEIFEEVKKASEETQKEIKEKNFLDKKKVQMISLAIGTFAALGSGYGILSFTDHQKNQSEFPVTTEQVDTKSEKKEKSEEAIKADFYKYSDLFNSKAYAGQRPGLVGEGKEGLTFENAKVVAEILSVAVKGHNGELNGESEIFREVMKDAHRYLNGISRIDYSNQWVATGRNQFIVAAMLSHEVLDDMNDYKAKEGMKKLNNEKSKLKEYQQVYTDAVIHEGYSITSSIKNYF